MFRRSAEIAFSLDQPPPGKLPLTLVLALPRPKMLRRILRTVGECGVRELHLINSYKVEKSFWQSPLLVEHTMRDYLLQGLEQASDTIVPEVQLHTRFKPFAEDLLPTLAKLAGSQTPCIRNMYHTVDLWRVALRPAHRA